MAVQPMLTSHKLVAGQKSFTYQGIKLVSNLDFNLADCDTVTSIKRKMTQYLVNTRIWCFICIQCVYIPTVFHYIEMCVSLYVRACLKTNLYVKIAILVK